MDIARVGVVGLGTMGAGIAEVFARAGLAVVATEVSADALERGRAILRRSVDRAVERGRLADASVVLDRLNFDVGLAGLSDVDLVIEAVPERLDLKLPLFAELDRVCRPEAILATNTSSLPVTAIAMATGRPERVVGMHFFNPAPVMKLVEVIRTVRSDDAVVAAVAALGAKLGKTPVTVGDRAGFIANHLLFGYLNDAVAMLESGFATAGEIDAAMRYGAGLPMGPFALLDLIGLDVAVEILETLYARGGRSRRHAPAPLLTQLVAAGRLGRKSGGGFAPAEPAPAVPADGVTVAVVGEIDLGGKVKTVDVADADVVLVAADPARPVIEAAMAAGRPAATVGVHPVGELVELVRTVRTSDAAIAAARAVYAGRPVVVCGDRAGFVVHALLVPYLNDAVRMLADGYATADDIDHAMRLGCGFPHGPIATVDTLGPGRVLDLQRAVFAQWREPSLAPAPLLEQVVAADVPLRS